MTTYAVTRQNVYAAQVGERYEWGREDSEAELLADGLSCEDALRVMAEAEWDGEPYRIVHTRHGLDTVEYQTVCVEKYDDDGAFEAVVDIRESLPEKLRDAMKRAEQSYWKYLDYEEDDYANVEDCF